jgi:hypothetical protein
MTRNERAVLLGMCLGDGCIKKKARDYREFSISHSPKQLDYLKHKTERLHSILGGKYPNIHLASTTLSNSKAYTYYRVSRQHKYFKLLHRWLYNNEGKKYFTRSILNMLNEEALAYWYMDDGSLVVTRNKENNISSFQVRLYTYCSFEEASTISDYFQEVWNVKFNIKKHTGKEQYCLRANTTEANKLMHIIYKYKVPCLEYKFIEPRARNTHSSDDIV